MDKREEVSRPNAAPRDSVRDAQRRIEALGVDFHEAVEAAGISRNTGYKFLRGEASLGKLRQLEDWIVTEERKRKIQPPMERDALLEEWATLGRDLLQIDTVEFNQMVDGLRKIVEAKKLLAAGITQMFRPNPDRR